MKEVRTSSSLILPVCEKQETGAQGLQHENPLSPPLSPGIGSHSCEPMMMLSTYPILYHPLLLLLSVFPSIRLFSSVLAFASGGQSLEFQLQRQ